MKFYLLVFISMVAPSIVWAQTSTALQLPEGPLLKRISAPAAWTITSQGASAVPSSGTNDSNPTAPAKIANPRITSVIKDPNFVYEKILTENGISQEIWHIENLAIVNQNKTGWFITPGSETFNTTDYTKSDFAGFDWISLENFTGIRDVNGKHCLAFKSQVITADPQDIANMKSIYDNMVISRSVLAIQSGKTPEPLPAFNMDPFKSDVEADIDNDTRLPVQLIYKGHDGKTVTRSYLFQSPPAQLSLPPEVEKILKDFQNRERRIPTGPAPI